MVDILSLYRDVLVGSVRRNFCYAARSLVSGSGNVHRIPIRLVTIIYIRDLTDGYSSDYFWKIGKQVLLFNAEIISVNSLFFLNLSGIDSVTQCGRWNRL